MILFSLGTGRKNHSQRYFGERGGWGIIYLFKE
jgi:hypothetical protein